MVQTRETNKDAHPGLVDRPPARKSRQQIADERKEAEQKKKGKQKVVSDVMEIEDAIRTKEAQERAEARQPRGPGVSKVIRPPPSTQSVTTSRARDTDAQARQRAPKSKQSVTSKQIKDMDVDRSGDVGPKHTRLKAPQSASSKQAAEVSDMDVDNANGARLNRSMSKSTDSRIGAGASGMGLRRQGGELDSEDGVNDENTSTKRKLNKKGNDESDDSPDERRPPKKTKPASTTSSRFTSPVTLSGVLPNWTSLVATNVPNYSKKPALPHGKINRLSQNPQAASESAPNSPLAKPYRKGPSINTYAGLDMPDPAPDLLDFHDDFDAPAPPTSGDLNEDSESNSEQLVMRPPRQDPQSTTSGTVKRMPARAKSAIAAPSTQPSPSLNTLSEDELERPISTKRIPASQPLPRAPSSNPSVRLRAGAPPTFSNSNDTTSLPRSFTQPTMTKKSKPSFLNADNADGNNAQAQSDEDESMDRHSNNDLEDNYNATSVGRKAQSSRLRSADSIKHYEFKTRAVVLAARPPTKNTQLKRTKTVFVTKKSSNKHMSELGDEGTGIDDDDDDDDDSDLADDSDETNRPRAKTKRRRRRKRQVSQKFRNEDLPAGTARRFRSIFLPMWYEHVAHFEEPWDLGDRTSDAQSLWDSVFPQYLHRLEKKNEPVFFLIKQRTYNWRGLFASRGEKAVAAYIARQQNDFDTPTEIAAYVEWAVPDPQLFASDEGTGHAAPPIFPFMWAGIDEDDPQNPMGNGPFQHDVILDTFAFYLESIANIPSDIRDTSPPKAALALATVAAERAWKQWATGELVQTSFDDKFSASMWGIPTQEVMESIDHLKPRTWEKILKGAAGFIGAHKSKATRTQNYYSRGGGVSGRALCYDSSD